MKTFGDLLKLMGTAVVRQVLIGSTSDWDMKFLDKAQAAVSAFHKEQGVNIGYREVEDLPRQTPLGEESKKLALELQGWVKYAPFPPAF